MIPGKKDRGQSPDNPDLIVPSTADEECESCLEEDESCPGISSCEDDKNSMS